jgi:hypothetical protein
MTPSPSALRWSLARRGCALALASTLACAARQSAPSAPTLAAAPPVAPPVEAAAEETAPPPPPEPEVPRPSATTDGIVTLIAKPGLWPLDVDSARRVLEALGPVEREQPTPESLELKGGPFGALDRFGVAYALDDERYWVFGSAGFLIGDADPVQLYRSIRARLTELLGKPSWIDEESGAGLPTTAWDIGEAMTLSLAPREEGDDRWVLIAIAEQDEKR